MKLTDTQKQLVQDLKVKLEYSLCVGRKYGSTSMRGVAGLVGSSYSQIAKDEVWVNPKPNRLARILEEL